MTAVLTTIVRDRQGIQFEGEAKAVSSQNEKGVFDILPGHAHFISTITKEVHVHLINGQKQSFAVSRGMISSLDDTVTVLLGIVPDA